MARVAGRMPGSAAAPECSSLGRACEAVAPCVSSGPAGQPHQARTTVMPSSTALSSSWRMSSGPVRPGGRCDPASRGAPAAASITSHLRGKGGAAAGPAASADRGGWRHGNPG